MLLNDIDLLVTGPGGRLYYGNGANFFLVEIKFNTVITYFLLGFQYGDDSNPNEQVTIDDPTHSEGCEVDFCEYTVSLQSGTYLQGGLQHVGLVITTSGYVVEPNDPRYVSKASSSVTVSDYSTELNKLRTYLVLSINFMCSSCLHLI